MRGLAVAAAEGDVAVARHKRILLLHGEPSEPNTPCAGRQRTDGPRQPLRETCNAAKAKVTHERTSLE